MPWAELTHCYGPATGVPTQLCDLASPDEDTRTRAWGSMGSNLYHQGDVFEATAHAIPFLLHLLADDTFPGRKQLLGYLAALVTGAEESQWFPDGYDSTVNDGRPVEIAVYEAVEAGIPTVVAPILDYEDPRTATLAAVLTAWFPTQAPHVLPSLRRLCDRPLPRAERATALIALGLPAGAAA
ncbi:hypothetical protein [Streptomyces sp. TE33382]